MKIAIHIGGGAPAPLVLFAASLVRAMGSLEEIVLLEDEPVDLIDRDPALRRRRPEPGTQPAGPLRVVTCGAADALSGLTIAESWQLSLVTEPLPEARLDGPRGRHRFALGVAPEILAPYERLDAAVPRVLVECDDGEARREKMASRVVREARRRKWPCVVVAVGGERGLVAKTLDPDEHYADPTAAELAAILMSTSVVLDPSDEAASPSTLARLGQSVAIPIVTHATSALARRVTTDVRLAEEWSPDAFCDLLALGGPSGDQQAPWGAEFETIADDFARVLTIG